MSTYFTSDLHLGHRNIHKYRDRFETAKDNDEYILNLMSKLTKRDVLYVLGDFLFDGDHFDEYVDRIAAMPCRIKLVFGNHDSLKMLRHYPRNVEFQLPLFVYKSFWLSHCPIHPDEMRDRLGNVHGHLHEEVVTKPVYKWDSIEMCYEPTNRTDTRYFNVNIDVNDYTFVPLEDIKQYFKDNSEQDS